MLSESTINILLSGVLSTLISSCMLIINNRWMSSINNELQLKREKQQHIWQIEREKEQRNWQEKSDQQKWYREKIYSSYTKTLEILTNIIKVRINDPELSSLDMIKLVIEFDSELNMIISGHPARDSDEFKKKIIKIDNSFRPEHWVGRETLIEIMEKDSRIKFVNNNT